MVSNYWSQDQGTKTRGCLSTSHYAVCRLYCPSHMNSCCVLSVFCGSLMIPNTSDMLRAEFLDCVVKGIMARRMSAHVQHRCNYPVEVWGLGTSPSCRAVSMKVCEGSGRPWHGRDTTGILPHGIVRVDSAGSSATWKFQVLLCGNLQSLFLSFQFMVYWLHRLGTLECERPAAHNFI